MNKYFYKVYGLTVESDVFLSELIEAASGNKCEEENIDVIIRYSDVNSEIKKNINKGIHCSFSKDECWFLIDNIAIYRVCNGKEIFIESIGGSQYNIKTFLLGSAFGCLLIQRNIVAIHGGTILMNNKSIIITGDSGVGKSTLTATLSSIGYKFLADDVSAISTNFNGEVIVNPAYPQQKLCRDAAIKLGLKIENLIIINESRDKFAISCHEKFIQVPKKLSYIIEIAVKEDEWINNDVTMEEVLGISKIQSIVKNIYRTEIAKIIGINGEYFKQIVNIAKQIKYYKIVRPKNLFSLQEEIKLIVSQIG